VSPVKYELDFYIPEDDILHSHCSENLKAYKTEKHTNPKFCVKLKTLTECFQLLKKV
jgi:hypothetical protein